MTYYITFRVYTLLHIHTMVFFSWYTTFEQYWIRNFIKSVKIIHRNDQAVKPHTKIHYSIVLNNSIIDTYRMSPKLCNRCIVKLVELYPCRKLFWPITNESACLKGWQVWGSQPIVAESRCGSRKWCVVSPSGCFLRWRSQEVGGQRCCTVGLA